MSRDAADLWTRLANDIRAVDGNHDLGAGELAHRLVERGWTLAPAASEPGLDALYERVAAMLCQHVADAEAHETTSEAIDDWHGVTARTIVSIVRATPPDPPT